MAGRALSLSAVIVGCLLGLFALAPAHGDPITPWWQPYAADDPIQEISLKGNLRMPTPEMVIGFGYECQTHSIPTSDGYILNLHRIPNPGKPVVFIQHGLLSSSADFVVLGPAKALALILFDAGYDVWLGNARGNTYSKGHVDKNISRKKYWDFSWHEIGMIDIPTKIDYILSETGMQNLTYVGHSQGTTVFFVMASLLPEYNDKINAMFALAPVAFVDRINSLIMRLIAKGSNQIGFITSVLGLYEFLPSNKFINAAASWICSDGSIIQPICTNILFLIAGYDSEQLDTAMLPELLLNVPAGAATKQLVHYGQLVNSDSNFRQFDYGLLKNLYYYGQWSPPEYPLDNIRAPVYLHYGDNDKLSVPADVAKIFSKLTNAEKKEIWRVPFDKFNHLDFIYAKDARSLLYDKVVNDIHKHNQK